MATFPTLVHTATEAPTIIDLHHAPTKAHPAEEKHPKHDIETKSTEPSHPPRRPSLNEPYPSSDEDHDVDYVDTSDGADSDSMDGMTEPTSFGEGSVGRAEEAESSESDVTDFDLTRAILSGLCPSEPGAAKTITTMVLYDDRGLQLFDEITYLKEYYLTTEEIEILKRDSDRIVDHIPDNSVVVELGAGSLRKTVLLLDALNRRRKNIRYYALDLMLDELTKSLKSLGSFTNVKTAGLWGTYDEGLAFVSSLGSEVPKTLLWLGSSIGNLTREEAKSFMTSYRKTLNVGDNWLIGIDRRNDPQDITLAYNDPQNVTRDFILNGLDHINVILGQAFIDREKFAYFARYNVEEGRHEAYYQVKEMHTLVYKDPTTEEDVLIHLKENELINVEYSYKWSPEETRQLFEETEMTKVGQWTSSSNRYDLHLIRKTPFYFQPAGSNPCPTREEWLELWKAWDVVTMHMIQHPSMLLEKPIDLRHPFIFYLGHIPTFLDMQLSRVLGEQFTEPANFSVIFERGIDPDVEDPTKCHAHSEVPETWPEIDFILSFRDRVHERLLNVLSDPTTYPRTRRLNRMLFMAFEHEVMHIETLLYMMVQSPNTRPPPSLQAPWGSSTMSAAKDPQPATWIRLDPATLSGDILTLGHDDTEASDYAEKADDTTSPFGWDNENPKVQPQAPAAYDIQSRQVSNGEFFDFLKATGGLIGSAPSSWLVQGDEDVSIKSVYGPVPIGFARDWPVSCSNVQATAYAFWAGSRDGVKYSLPTEHEMSIAYKLKQSTVPRTGLENYGFRQWYPLQDQAFASSENLMAEFSGPGGLWDWTRSEFLPLSKDFVPSTLYPAYSVDFFDHKHFVVLGASWATHQRIAERRSFRNWYQANYPYVFAGFRLVKAAA